MERYKPIFTESPRPPYSQFNSKIISENPLWKKSIENDLNEIEYYEEEFSIIPFKEGLLLYQNRRGRSSRVGEIYVGKNGYYIYNYKERKEKVVTKNFSSIKQAEAFIEKNFISLEITDMEF